MGNTGSIATVPFPAFLAKHLVESEKEYQFLSNGFTITLPLDLTKDQIRKSL
jgi:leucyl-tRNA synthetase